MQCLNKTHLHLKSAFLILTVLIAVCSLIFPAYAVSVNATEIPERIGNQLGTTEFIGGIIASALVLLFPTVMIAFAIKKQATSAITYTLLIVDFVIMGGLVALTWLPYWIFLVLSLMIGLLFASSIRDIITGK